MAELAVTTFDADGNIISDNVVDIPDPEPTVEERLAAVEAIVVDPAGDSKSLAAKVDELQQLLVRKAVIDKADAIAISADVAVEDVAAETGGVKPKAP